MKPYRNTGVVIAVVGALAVLAAACGANAPEPVTTPSPTVSLAPTIEAEETSTPSPTSIAETYDSNATMYRLFPDFNSPRTGSLGELEAARIEQNRRLQVLENIEDEKDLLQVPVMIEVMRFLRSKDERDAIADVLQVLTGQELGGNEWFEWTEWYGRNSDDFPPPSEYIDWKINLMSQLSPRFADFLRPAKELSHINVTEIQWGGVLPDGIPDLQNPPHITPDEATYLEFDERVFGKSGMAETAMTSRRLPSTLTGRLT